MTSVKARLAQNYDASGISIIFTWCGKTFRAEQESIRLGKCRHTFCIGEWRPVTPTDEHLRRIAVGIQESSAPVRERFGRGQEFPLGENLEPGTSESISSIGTFDCRPETRSSFSDRKRRGCGDSISNVPSPSPRPWRRAGESSSGRNKPCRQSPFPARELAPGGYGEPPEGS